MANIDRPVGPLPAQFRGYVKNDLADNCEAQSALKPLAEVKGVGCAELP